MDEEGNNSDKKICCSEEAEVRKGPWTMEEDLILMNYIANHGEGVWNTLAKSAGLKRTGKSCRLRWLNYLRPDVRRGNITPEEQLLIMDLHSRWGNRWSKIARQLPGRTDNEIKNYWRTRIQKKPKQGETFDYMPTQLMADDASTSNPTCMDLDYSGAADPQNYQMQPNTNQSNNTVNAFGAPSFSTPDASENFWTVDDFWSIQPSNGAVD